MFSLVNNLFSSSHFKTINTQMLTLKNTLGSNIASSIERLLHIRTIKSKWPKKYRFELDSVIPKQNKEGQSMIPLLEEEILAVDHIKKVSTSKDSVSITLDDSEHWGSVKPFVEAILRWRVGDGIAQSMEELEAMVSMVPMDSNYEEHVLELVIDAAINPMLARDGGSCSLICWSPVAADELTEEQLAQGADGWGIAVVDLHGACSGCQHSTATLESFVDQAFQHFIPKLIRTVKLEDDE
eukprot:gnl/Dysnectes_brevis/1626_a1851_2959.p1 GENE.gnl/Dysnectes_brevis/1626_a1851_2959~~gnl/Dysnectes_brevis/1626_a1851_2959.p1  ORF type:complete len:240 (+),score=37.49 gnl/Dysnectes_brevis/1626_a1851_2959:55-774(+)